MNSYKATQLKFEGDLKRLGFSFPPQQTLSNWKNKVLLNQPARETQGGHRKAFLEVEEFNQLHDTISGVQAAGGVVTWHLVRRLVVAQLAYAGKAFVSGTDKRLFPSPSWCRAFFVKIGTHRRAGTHAARRPLPSDIAEIQQTFMLQIAHDVWKYKIPKSCVGNADETGVPFFKQHDRTQAPIGAKQVPIFGADDKRQFTVMNCGTAAGVMAPLGVVFEGVEHSTRAIPKLPLGEVLLGLKGAHLQQTNDHWMNSRAMIKYCTSVLLPFVNNCRRDASNSAGYFLLILDVHASHLGVTLRQLLRKNKILLHYIFPGLTGELQPMDISVQGIFKSDVAAAMEKFFQELLLAHMAAHNGSWEGFDFGMSKKDLGVPFLRALSEANVKLASDERKAARFGGWRQFETCWDTATQEKAKARFDAGTLYPKAKGNKRSKAVIVEALLLADALEKEEEEQAVEVDSESVPNQDVEHDQDSAASLDFMMEEEEEDAFEEKLVLEQEEDPEVIEQVLGKEEKTIKVVEVEFTIENLRKMKVTIAGRQFLAQFKDLPRSNNQWIAEDELLEDGHGSLIEKFLKEKEENECAAKTHYASRDDRDRRKKQRFNI